MSVLLPVRNAEQTVDAALESIRFQSYADFELVIVDDGSSDGTRSVLEAHARADSRLRILNNGSGDPVDERGSGDLVAALERGRQAARGEFLLRMDADDLAHPRRLEQCMSVLTADPRLAGVGCLVRSFPEATLRQGRRRYDAWLNGLRTHEAMARERFVESPLAHPSVLLRASALAEVDGYRAFDGPEDYDLWLRLFGAGWRFEKVPRVLHFWRDRPDRLSRVDERYSAAGMTRARAAALAQELNGRPAAIVGAGTAGRRLARALLALGVRVTCFLDTDPRKVGRAPYGVPVLEHHAGLKQRGDALVITCINAWGARTRVRSWLRKAGLVEGRDFVLAA